MLLSEFNKVVPMLKSNGCWVTWLNKAEYSGWYNYQTLAARYDFKKIQVVKCRYKTVYRFDAETDLELTLRKL